jgi:orotidine-5'-phosphate decarboxylase
MNRSDLFHLIQQKKSFLCVGLDSDFNKIPKYLLGSADQVFEFNKQFIDALQLAENAERLKEFTE